MIHEASTANGSSSWRVLSTLSAMPKIGDVIAAAVRAERARRRWTQAHLAQELGIALTTVAELEAGRRRVQVDDLPALCRVFDLPLAALLRDADEDDVEALGL